MLLSHGSASSYCSKHVVPVSKLHHCNLKFGAVNYVIIVMKVVHFGRQSDQPCISDFLGQSWSVPTFTVIYVLKQARQRAYSHCDSQLIYRDSPGCH